MNTIEIFFQNKISDFKIFKYELKKISIFWKILFFFSNIKIVKIHRESIFQYLFGHQSTPKASAKQNVLSTLKIEYISLSDLRWSQIDPSTFLLFRVTKSPRECEKWILYKILHRLSGPFFLAHIFLINKLILKSEKYFRKIFKFYKGKHISFEKWNFRFVFITFSYI